MTDLMERLRQAAAEPGRGRQSPLRRWMEAHREGFAAALPARPNWHAIARELAAQGLTDGTGKPPSASVACLTWFRVKEGRQAKAEKQAERRAKEPPASSPQASAAPAAPADPPPVTGRRFRRVGEQ